MGPPLLSYLVLKTKLPVVQFKAFSAVKNCGFEPKNREVLTTVDMYDTVTNEFKPNGFLPDIN